MSYTLNKKIKDLVPYEPIQGNYKIRLDANESFFKISEEEIDKAIKNTFIEGINRYPDPYAKDVITAFSKLYELNPRNVVAGNGSDELISLVTTAFFEHNDKLAVYDVEFSMYAFYTEVCGIEKLVLNKKEDLTIDVDETIRQVKTSNAKGLIFSNPCNPTSIVLERAEVIRIVEELKDCLIIVDEAYMDFSNHSVLNLVNNYDNLVVLKTCSKAVGVAGIRLGFAVANENIINAFKAVKSPYNVNSISQSVGTVILNKKEYLESCKYQIIKSRDFLYKEICNLAAKYDIIKKIYKSETNFIYLKLNKSNEIFKKLLNNSIAVRKFDGYFRITAGTEDENKVLLETFENILKGEL